MLSRYSMERGKKLVDYPERVRRGVRIDTRKHTKHCLRPDAEAVRTYLRDPSEAAWEAFAASYIAGVEARMGRDPAPFDALAESAASSDVFIGCNCPTYANPDVNRCHTVLALSLMQRRYPQLAVEFP